MAVTRCDEEVQCSPQKESGQLVPLSSTKRPGDPARAFLILPKDLYHPTIDSRKLLIPNWIVFATNMTIYTYT